MLSSIRVHNFKAVADSGPVRLTPLTVFVGHNGTGKSSIVCAICLGLGGEPYLTAISDTRKVTILPTQLNDKSHVLQCFRAWVLGGQAGIDAFQSALARGEAEGGEAEGGAVHEGGAVKGNGRLRS